MLMKLEECASPHADSSSLHNQWDYDIVNQWDYETLPKNFIS